MPYFRWLGPTAIMPGFKQMVVKVRRQDTEAGRASTDGGAAAVAGVAASPSFNTIVHAPESNQHNQYATGIAPDVESGNPMNLPFYDSSPMPPSELITHLANTFFIHLGCNYPFLQRERFLRDLEEKQVDAILVDAVCAIAARFSTHPLIVAQTSDDVKATPAEYGHAFAQRAQRAIIDTFSFPSVAAVQAALLLAYVEFGESRDSGLWMYLGISIRMAQDLGLHKIEGLKYRGTTGPTPKMIKRESTASSAELPSDSVSGGTSKKTHDDTRRVSGPKEKCGPTDGIIGLPEQLGVSDDIDELKAVEQERVDTFWAVFFLDRMISSGTGRRSTLRDKDIELSFPALETTDTKSGWPAAFPALIRIVHLYGRVADLLNSIKEPSDITTETPRKIASMESQVTNFYQGLSPRLHFDAVNFQHYNKAGEGTNFVLLHFWFHTLIVLLHQPTLFKTFEGKMLQLFPNSQQLSMSSAKTIADILSYSQLMDAKASLGNPFTSQPIYIAACAFLKETVAQSASSTAQSRVQSRACSPVRKETSAVEDQAQSLNATPDNRKRLSIGDLTNPPDGSASDSVANDIRRSSTMTDEHKSSDKSGGSSLSAAKAANAIAKHTLLARAASQHYELCYKALVSLETYWAGAKYILTILDQKFNGIDDPLLYTVEEGESSMERPKPEPSFTTPGWRRKLSGGRYLYDPNISAQDLWMNDGLQLPSNPGGDNAKAIGWTLTGTMNSPSTNLAWHYPSGAVGTTMCQNSAPISNDVDPSTGQGMQYPTQMQPAQSNPHHPSSLNSYGPDGSAISDHDNIELLMQMNPPAQANGIAHLDHSASADFTPSNPHDLSNQQNFTPAGPTTTASYGRIAGWMAPPTFWHGSSSEMHPFSDMMIESQDVDMNMLGLDMMPWFDSYPTHDLGGLFQPGLGHDPR